MKTLEYVKENYSDFEKDTFFDRRFTKCFIDFLPISKWESYGFKYIGDKFEPKEWNEENVLEQLRKDVFLGYYYAVSERGISSELMAMVVDSWCKVLENGLDLDGDDGYYHIKQFEIVAEHYGWGLCG